jgi:hypothetical protein
VFTTLTTGQAATQTLLSPQTTTILSSVTLFVSIFNSFFKPYEQLTKNQQILQDWTKIGDEFDEIYYNRVYTREEKLTRLVSLEKLFKSMSTLKRANDNNYCIDCMFIFIRLICIRKNITWVQIKEDPSKKRRLSMLTSNGVVTRQPININETIV